MYMYILKETKKVQSVRIIRFLIEKD